MRSYSLLVVVVSVVLWASPGQAQQLQAGDANMDYEFNQWDLVQVQIAAKYLTGEPATWGEGDWDGAPGGSQGSPPPGNGLFEQMDIIAALSRADAYGWGGPYAAIRKGGVEGDDQTSVIYDVRTGEIAVEAPTGRQLMHVSLQSEDAIFILGMFTYFAGTMFDHESRDLLATGGSQGVDGGSFGYVAPAGLSEEYVLGDLTLFGALSGGSALGDVDLIYIAELLPQLRAGDANMDLEFNQLDLVQVLVAAKYLTGEPATWGEGDWTGAPGGYPGNPPPGNGVFDQLDLIAAIGGPWNTGPYAAIKPGGVIADEQTSIGYNPSTGELWVDAPASTNLTSINIDSAASIFTGAPAENLGGSFDNDADNNIFKATFGSSFGSLSFGNVAQTGLSEDFVANDLTVVGSLAGGGDLGPVDLIYTQPAPALRSGDANRDFVFDQLDIVQVLQAGKYLTGEPATWGEGDWNGAPGGSQGNPPSGDGLFNQLDIIAALACSHCYRPRWRPYAAIKPGGIENDDQTSIGYDAVTGAVWVDAPAGTDLTSINIDSAAGIFTGDPAQNLGGSFDNDADNNIFKATFGSSFGSLSFGNVAQAGLSEDFVLNDLTVVGSLNGGGDLGAVDYVGHIPEPSSLLLALLGIVGLLHWRRWRK